MSSPEPLLRPWWKFQRLAEVYRLKSLPVAQWILPVRVFGRDLDDREEQLYGATATGGFAITNTVGPGITWGVSILESEAWVRVEKITLRAEQGGNAVVGASPWLWTWQGIDVSAYNVNESGVGANGSSFSNLTKIYSQSALAALPGGISQNRVAELYPTDTGGRSENPCGTILLKPGQQLVLGFEPPVPPGSNPYEVTATFWWRELTERP